MPHRATTALQEILRPHVGLGKSRLETLCQITVGMISARTVNLSHVASEWSGAALTASAYRRAQRFFQHARLPADWAAPLVIRLLRLKGAWRLALDRTQWKVGVKDVNILMLAVHLAAFHQGWFIAKFVLVVALTGYQGWIAAYGKKLAQGSPSWPSVRS